jgi:hypothetical protein
LAEAPCFNAYGGLRGPSHKSVAHQSLGSYEILAPIGKGGIGEVDDEVPPQAFATGSAPECFQREASAASVLNHPNICALLDVGGAAGHPWLPKRFRERDHSLTLMAQ